MLDPTMQNILKVGLLPFSVLILMALAILMTDDAYGQDPGNPPTPAKDTSADASTSTRTAPQITSLTHPTLSSITVNWQAADDTDQHWIYSVKSDGSGGSFQRAVPEPPPSQGASGKSGGVTGFSHATTVTGLDDGVRYWFVVIGVDAPSAGSPEDWFSWSNWGRGSTLTTKRVSVGPDVSVSEGGTANITVTASVAPQTPLTVNYAIGADNDTTTVDANSDDYTGNATGTILIAVGVAQGTIPVVTNGDTDIDDGTRETLVVTVSLPEDSGYEIGTRASATVTINEGVCDRTTEVRTAILGKLTGISDCAQVTDADLSSTTGTLRLSGHGIASLKAKDFHGLTSLQGLRLSNNSLASLPEDIFDGLTGLQELRLSNNSLASLLEDIFDGLTGLQELRLSNNSLASLPGDIFDGLSSLRELRLIDNSLTTLPEDMFDGLNGLRGLYLQTNPGSPFTFTAELEQTSANEVRVAVAEAAPFDLTAALSVQGGTLSTGTVVVPAGSGASAAITVTPSGDGSVTVRVASASFPASSVATDGVTVNYNGIQTGVPVTNQAPTADAGSDQTVAVGEEVTLDASGSRDPDTGDTLNYSWTQTDGTTVFYLSNSTSTSPTFNAPSSTTTLTFQVSVTDGRGGSDTDSVNVTLNQAPTADAGPDQTVAAGAVVTLNASGSSDPDTGDTLNYSWTQTAGTTVLLNNSTSSSPTFTAPSSTTKLTFQVSVTDGRGGSDTDSVNVTLNQAPTADAGLDQTVAASAVVTLNASGSSDPDTGDTLSYSWTQTAGTSTVTLSSATSTSPTFTAPSSTTKLTFQVSVMDGRGGSDTDSVDITVVTSPAAPSNLKATPGNGQITLNWDDPNDATITRYEYRLKEGTNNWGTWTAIAGSGTTTVEYVKSGLTNGTAYTSEVRAVNVAGEGPSAQTGPVIPVLPYQNSYRFNNDTTTWTWPFPSDVSVRATLVGGQGGQGRSGTPGTPGTQKRYHTNDYPLQEPVTGSNAYSTRAEAEAAYNAHWSHLSAGDTFQQSGYTWHVYSVWIGRHHADHSLWAVNANCYRIYYEGGTSGTPARTGGTGASTLVTIGTRALSASGNAGGTGALPVLPSASITYLTSIAIGTAVTIDVGVGGAGNGGASGSDGYVLFDVVVPND